MSQAIDDPGLRKELGSCFYLQIPLTGSEQEIREFMEYARAVEAATQLMLSGHLSFVDLMECIEPCVPSIDEYVEEVEENLNESLLILPRIMETWMPAAVYQIKSDETASAIFGSFASGAFKSAYTALHKTGTQTVQALTKSVVDGFEAVKKKVNQGWQFFKTWFNDDPISATAAVAAGVLTLGVIVVVAGSATGAIVGGLAALRSLRLITLAKGALAVALGAGVVGSIIRFAVRGVQFAWNFNWNITDKQIRAQQEGLVNSLYGQAGEALGSTLGTLLCGAAPVEVLKRANVVKVNPMMLAKIREVTQFDPHNEEYGELYEEMMENLKALVKTGTKVATQIAFIESFKNIRKFIKGFAKNSGLAQAFPGLGKLVEKWGEEGSQAWSFASAVENAVESISDQNIQNFTEELVESFMDACTESTMIISYVF